MINLKSFDPNNVKVEEKSCKNILICYIGCVMIKDSKYLKIYSVNPLYVIFNKANGYFEEINGNIYLMLVPTNESKEKIKQYKWLLSEIRDLFRLMTKNSDDYDEKYIKIGFNSDDELPLNKTIEVPIMIIVVRAIFMKITNIIYRFS